MASRPVLAVLSIAVGIANAFGFVALLYFEQGLADTVDPVVPFWLGPSWFMVSFPGRFLYLLPALNHPFGFGEHEDLTLYLIASLNGIIWALTLYFGAAKWLQRRQRGASPA
jgi:hypothetical protein